MIQRIQTIYIFLASACLSLFSFLEPARLFAEEIGHQSTAIITIAAALIAFISLFLYKKRKLQGGIVLLANLAALIALIPLFVFYNWEEVMKLWPFYLIPIASLLLILAKRGITKDEKLVKSMDRLR